MENAKHFYKVVVELGHLGCGKSTTTSVYCHTTSAYKAMEKAKKLPAVKHNKLPMQVILISEEEYKKGIETKDYYEKISML